MSTTVEQSSVVFFLTFKMPDKNYEMNLIFSGDVVIKLVTEAIDLTLDDQGSPWESKNKPNHDDL